MRSSGQTKHDGRGAPVVVAAELSIVIPCLNAATCLPRQLDALAAQRWDRRWEVIVADNGSTDATAAVARTYVDRVPNLRVVDASARRGRQHACNAGARAAAAAIAFVDADDEVAPGYVAAIGDALAVHPIVAASIDHVSLNDGWTRESASGAQARALQDGFGFLPFGSGGTLGVRADVFDALDGFADDMHYAEDIDFCWRAQLAGLPIHFVPGAQLRYRYRPGIRSMYRQHRNFGRASALLYRTYRSHGMPRRDTRTCTREWLMIGKGAVALRSRADVARWSRRVGRCVGRLQGSAHYRVWYP